ISRTLRGAAHGAVWRSQMKNMTLAAFVAVVLSLFALVVPVSAFADPPPPIPQEDCEMYKNGYTIMKADPHCAGLLTPTPTPVVPVPTQTYKLLCQEGTTGEGGIHWENGDATHVGGNHCMCAVSPDPVVRVTGDFAGTGRVEVCLSDLRARLGKVEGDVANH